MVNSIVQRIGYIIHDVAADGNCLFAAIDYQLSSIGIYNIDIHDFHLEKNPYVNDVATLL